MLRVWGLTDFFWSAMCGRIQPYWLIRFSVQAHWKTYKVSDVNYNFSWQIATSWIIEIIEIFPHFSVYLNLLFSVFSNIIMWIFLSRTISPNSSYIFSVWINPLRCPTLWNKLRIIQFIKQTTRNVLRMNMSNFDRNIIKIYCKIYTEFQTNSKNATKVELNRIRCRERHFYIMLCMMF